ncbi:MAG: hypothetical protein ACMXYK_05060 [Candidatus Woesearchaeota archaeon]
MKAQSISLDFIIGITITTGILFFAIMQWNLAISQQQQLDTRTDIYTILMQATENLVTTQGHPHNWHETGNIQSLGLLGGSTISQDKIDALALLDHSTLQQKLGVAPYDIGLRINTFNGVTYENPQDIGILPHVNHTTTMQTTRYVQGDSIKQVIVYLSQ